MQSQKHVSLSSGHGFQAIIIVAYFLCNISVIYELVCPLIYGVELNSCVRLHGSALHHARTWMGQKNGTVPSSPQACLTL